VGFVETFPGNAVQQFVPFRGTGTAEVFDGLLNREPTPPVRLNPAIPSDLERIIAKACANDVIPLW